MLEEQEVYNEEARAEVATKKENVRDFKPVTKFATTSQKLDL